MVAELGDVSLIGRVHAGRQFSALQIGVTDNTLDKLGSVAHLQIPKCAELQTELSRGVGYPDYDKFRFRAGVRSRDFAFEGIKDAGDYYEVCIGDKCSKGSLRVLNNKI